MKERKKERVVHEVQKEQTHMIKIEELRRLTRVSDVTPNAQRVSETLYLIQ